MKVVHLLLFALLSVQGKQIKSKKTSRREANSGSVHRHDLHDAEFPPLSSGSPGEISHREALSEGLGRLEMFHHESVSSTGGSNYLSENIGHRGHGHAQINEGDGSHYRSERPVVPIAPPTDEHDPVGFQAIRNFAQGATAAIETYGPGNIPKSSVPTGAVTVGGVRVPGPVAGPVGGTGPHSNLDGPPYDFHAAMNAVNSAPFGNTADNFFGPSGQMTDERATNIFNYQPKFGGKDLNNFPHILPPGGKSIEQLQAEADEQLHAIMARAHEKQNQAWERIARLKSSYGTGTLGYDGYTDSQFRRTENFDLGTHKAIDLGTSIDYNRLKGADGKLKLPVQNVYHTKTLGIKIPEPYPVRHEVPVPAPYPVPQYIPVPSPTPTVVSAVPPAVIGHYQAATGHNLFKGGGSNYIQYDDAVSTEEGRPKDYTYSIENSKTIAETSSIDVVPSLSLSPPARPDKSYGPPNDVYQQFNPSVAIKSEFGMVNVAPMNFSPTSQSIQRPYKEYGVPK